MSFQKDGYTIIHNFLRIDQEDYRNTLDLYLQNNKSYNETGNSKIIPDSLEIYLNLNPQITFIQIIC